MGKYIIAGNWKMNKLPSETYDYIKEVIDATKGSECEVVCCTPFVCLPQAVEAARVHTLKSVLKTYTLRTRALSQVK